QVLQAAFSWDDYHLWRFCLGGGPFDHDNQLFLCPWDVEEGELPDEGGIPADEVRLDECLQDPGDVLGYVYDYGDNWELALRLEGVLPAAADAPSAVCIDGRRAAPPEDCGSLRDAEELAEVLEDPARFEIDEVNRALRAPYFALREAGIDPRLVDLVNRLAYRPGGEDLTARAISLMGAPALPENDELRDSLKAFSWFLDRAAEGGFQLTAAGYLKPADVEEAARIVPTMYDWIGKHNRESDTPPVLIFRELLQQLGLLRKYKGTLRITKAGAAARTSPQALWNTLARKLIPADTGFEGLAGLLILAYAATSPGAEILLDPIATALGQLGWETGNRMPIEAHDLYHVQTLRILGNVTSEQTSWRDRRRISPSAAALAHTALRQA
ncbi:MAG: plasmid pRiA4b ORF-3 family protein, partial [Acidobacteriota bacterium]|nr:plasmid pRiA4b ORF-3 family protein [Acidobacteriota bacterium]